MTTASITWLHIGDLHLKTKAAPNLRDLQQIVAAAAALPPGTLDFVLLPGDNADDGTPEQYRLVRSALSPLPLPLHVLPGDHDIASGDLGAFYDTLGAPRLPYATTIRNCRCLFLDVVSAGTGGPDFRLGPDQLDWAEREVAQAATDGRSVAIFMHTYPADLREGADRIGALLGQSHVACVDMGHTHYNELANDGGTIFMATRSTGQIEEGPPGFSVAALDSGCVSWRFKPLDTAWPLVLITCPADIRLTTALSRDADPATIRATVLSDRPIVEVTLHADGAPQPMHPLPDHPGIWQAALSERPHTIRVQARDDAGRTDHDQIELAPPGYTMPDTAADGSDKDRIGAWPARGIVGGQLGPNRNGRKW